MPRPANSGARSGLPRVSGSQVPNGDAVDYDDLYVPCNVIPCFLPGRVGGMVDALDFHGSVERLSESIVEALTRPICPDLSVGRLMRSVLGSSPCGGAFELADLFFMVADTGGDGFQRDAPVVQPPRDHVVCEDDKNGGGCGCQGRARLAARKRQELPGLLRSCFTRTGPWLQAGKYLSALAGGLATRNGRTIAEHAGDRSPDRTQRLLSRACWDTFAAMGVVRRFAVAGLDEAARRSGGRRGLVIGALDETGQEKSGTATAGVHRQYLGCAGKVTNGINTVHLAYERAGRALIGSRQWIPRAQIEDPVQSLVMGLPPDLEFRTKGQLAIGIAADALADGIWFDFFCGDEVHGSCTQLREFFEDQGQAYVMRVPRSFRLTLAGGQKISCAAAAALAGEAGVRSAGQGSKGTRWYGWSWLATASPRHCLLIRRRLRNGELAFHYCFVPERQPLILTRLIRAAGLRWPVEEQPRRQRQPRPG